MAHFSAAWSWGQHWKGARKRKGIWTKLPSQRPLESLEERRLLAGEGLVISELMASNATVLRDRFREYPDWIEIHNAASEAANLAGWHLTDDPENLTKWTFPDVTLDAQAYVVVFASGRDLPEANQMHTNFVLDGQGDYLALVRPDGSVTHAYAPVYPPQFSDVSYGLRYGAEGPQQGQMTFFVVPTPGAVNSGAEVSGQSTEVTASVERGYFSSPFSVALSPADPQSVLRYTTDGSEPTFERGELYTGPIQITTTTTLRAVALNEGLLPGRVLTHTYIFLDDVLKQDGQGLPVEWGYFDDQGPRRPARARANYAVDPTVANDERYRDTIRDDLRALPTLSIVMDPLDLWDFENGIYSNPERRGDAWERPISIEWMDVAGKTLFQTDAGLRVHGGWARRFTFTSKLSFRVAFRARYGPSTLEQPVFGPEGQQAFKQIVLRGGFNDSWQGGSRDNTYMQDQWVRQAQRDMGGYAPRDNYVHLYLNGLYWGMYSPTERPDAHWAAANLGGNPTDYDVINTGGNVIDGDSRAWTNLTRAVARNPINYDEVKQQLDVDRYIDYMIVNQYVGNWDWPHNNWFASRRRMDGAKWEFHSWDAEAAFQNGITEDRITRNVSAGIGPADMYLKLKQVPEFQQRYADRVYKHFYNGGVLTPQANVDRLNAIAATIDRGIVGESLRWGDGRTDSVRPPLTRDNAWLPRIRGINQTYFPRRHDVVLNQFRTAKLFTSTVAPEFNQAGGRITSDFDIRLTAPDGDIFYTTDGTDPRLPDGTMSPTAKRFNTVNLVNGAAPAKLLVPVGAASEANWQALEFDDTGWTEGFATFGFETEASDDPLVMTRGFRVREVHSSGRLLTLDDVDRMLAGENVASTQTFTRVPVINYTDSAQQGFFGDSLAFPAAGVDEFALDISGTLHVNQAGTYTFGVGRNDGARLELDGAVLFADTERHRADEVALVTIDLAAGDHTVRLVVFDHLGVGAAEFFFATGRKEAMDDSFVLLGDHKHRSYKDVLRSSLDPQLAGLATSAYARIPFTVSSLAQTAGQALMLRARFDDGFVAYLNGVEIARYAAADPVSFNSVASGTRYDVDSLIPLAFDVTASASLLREGTNVLAIQALNSDKLDPDMLFSGRLVTQLPDPSIRLNESARILARAELDGVWSPLAEADFRLSIPAGPNDVRISEIQYHPAPPNATEIAAGYSDAEEFEFIEIANLSDRVIDLTNTRFAMTTIQGELEGVDFDFADALVTELRPGERLVVVENLAAFRARYGDAIPIAGQWDGGLGNATETITLMVGDQIAHRFTYIDDWFLETDGAGASLEAMVRTDAALAEWDRTTNWQPSLPLGTPGQSPNAPTVSQPGDANRDGLFDSADLLQVLQRGEFEDLVDQNSGWEDGDWNGDGDFTTLDLVFAFARNLFVA